VKEVPVANSAPEERAGGVSGCSFIAIGAAAAGEAWGGEAESALEECRAWVDALFDGVETGLFIIDPETHRLLDANSVAVEMVGVPREKLVGSVCHKFICPAEAGRCPVTDLGQNVDNSERILLTARGERRTIIKTVRTVVVAGRRRLLESFIDISGLKRTEEALKERTAYLHTLIEVTPLGVLVLDLDERIEMANAAFESLFLYTRAETLGAKAGDLIARQEYAEEASELTRQCLEQGSARLVTRRSRKDGKLLDVQIFAVRLEIDGKPRGLLALYEDISAQVQTERAMAERHRLAALAAQVGDVLAGSDSLRQGLQKCAELLAGNIDVGLAGIWTADEQQGALELQASAGVPAGFDGAPARELLGRLTIEGCLENGSSPLPDPWLGDAAFAESLLARQEGLTAVAGYPLRVKDRVLGMVAAFGRQPFTSAMLETLGSVADNIAQFVERKRAEESLRESEERFRTAFEDAPYGMCMTTPEGRYMHANAAMCAMLGYTEHELQAGAWQQITHPEDLERSRQTLAELSRTGAVAVELEKRYLHRKGGEVWARLKISPAIDAHDGSSYFITQVEDITLRRQADAAQAFLASLVESSQDAIYGATIDGTIVSWNRGAEDLFGYAAEETIGRSVAMLLPPGYEGEFQGHLKKLGQDGQTCRRETVRVRKDGKHVGVMLTLSPVRDANGKVTGIAAIAHDMTARKQREQELRESEERYRELFENASAAIFTVDLQGHFTSLNCSGQQILGYTEEEAVKLAPYELVAPGYRKVLDEQRTAMLAGETELAAEIEVTAKNGRRVRLEAKPRLILRGGEPVGIQVIVRDITGRDLAEMELHQAQKLESVGRLASGIAHEINTPVQFVGDNTRFLKDAFVSLKTLLDKTSELRKAAAAGSVDPGILRAMQDMEEDLNCQYLLDEIPRAIAQSLEGVERIATLVRAMKEFAHPEAKEMGPADLNQALRSTITVSRNEWKYVADVETDFAELPPVVCNIGELNQVFLNLLVNAAHAIGDVVKSGSKGKIAIRTEEEDGKVHISFSDTGSGIEESIQSKIFDPFFTTKEVGRGTGQGLAIARSVIVERHRGALTFESAVGKGTTFHIRLPLTLETAAKRNRN
jgi:PAS domain S-box-containing protein